MSYFKTLEEAQEFFRADRFATDNGMVLDEIGEDWAKASVTLAEVHRNAQGDIMGGAIFTLGDLAFAAACNNVHFPSVAQQVSINLMSATHGSKLFAYAKCIKDGRSSGVYTVMITDDLGKDIALYTAVAFKKQ